MRKNIRNFCIIAHIDHGKSTLSKKIIKKITNNENYCNIIDSIKIENLKGITIKSKNIKLDYIYNNEIYNLNLIDTPGHIDFSYEIYKYLHICEGAILLIDSTKGVESQTIMLHNYLKNNNIKIIPIISKIDSINSNIKKTLLEINNILKIKENILQYSYKNEYSLELILHAIIKDIPTPIGNINDFCEIIIIDSWFDNFSGFVYLVKIKNGLLKKNIILKNINNITIKILELGYIYFNNKIKKEILIFGEIGWISTTNKKRDKYIKNGETLFDINKNNIDKIKTKNIYKLIPKIYVNIYPENISEYNKFKTIIENIYLNDNSLFFESCNSKIFGMGFKCGFMGQLHIEITKNILEKENLLKIIITESNIKYEFLTKDNKKYESDQITFKEYNNNIKEIREPICISNIITPYKYTYKIIKLCFENRGEYIKNIYLNKNYNEIIFKIPLYEIINDFSNKLKSISSGYATLNYYLHNFKIMKFMLLEVSINSKKIEELTKIVNKNNYIKLSNNIINNLIKYIKRRQYNIKIQILLNNKIIKSYIIKQFRKDITQKCYGGDITRKKKLINKQKKGKKKNTLNKKIKFNKSELNKILKI